MKPCLDTDVLASVGSMLGWEDALDGVRHLGGCASCQERLTQLGMIRRELSREATPRAGFVDTVLASTARARSRQLRGGRRLGAGDLLSPLLAALTALFTIGLAAEGGAVSLGPGVIGAAMLAGTATFVWNRSSGRKARPTA